MSKPRSHRPKHSSTHRAAFPRTPEAHQRAAEKPDNAIPAGLFADLLREAVTRPGILSEAYRAFHAFSLGNQILAASQLIERGMPIAPIASFNTWKAKGRMVRKGQKAIRLFMPVTLKRQDRDEETGIEQEIRFQTFLLKPHWFSLDQTDGAAYTDEPHSPDWEAGRAMAALSIEETPFEMLDGNCQGYATGNRIAINPLAVLPHKTRFHEIAHIVLGHTAESSMQDDERTPRNLREVEAEGVAYILCSVLDLPGRDESRGYVQNWLAGETIPDRNARRIFTAADKLIKAGQPAPEGGTA
jgi:antirestriction protein ArdC